MKIIVTAIGLVILICSAVRADMVYGVIKADGKPVGKGVKIEVLVKQAVIDSTLTNKKGAYRLMIAGHKEVVFRITYGDQTPTITVFVYDQPVRYNILLERIEGKYRARRE